ncbi:MAG: Mur ligase domain-containing protein [Nocardioides sp.]
MAATATDSEVLERLRAEGATVFAGHRAEQVEGAQVVVVSTAVPEDNPEVLARPGVGAADLAALRGCRVGDGRPSGARSERHPRQDHDHVPAHDGVASGRTRPDVRRRGRPGADRPQCRRKAAADSSWQRPTRATAPSSLYHPFAAIVTNVDGGPPRSTSAPIEAYHAAFAEFVDHRRSGRVSGVRSWTIPVPPPSVSWPRAHGLRFISVGQSAEAALRVTDVELSGGRTSFSIVEIRSAPGQADVAASPVGTTPSMPLPALAVGLRTRRGLRRSGRRLGVIHGHASTDGIQGRSRAGSGSTTATRITPPRSQVTSRPGAPWSNPEAG